ncbi:hypothetical protein BH18ACT15_BH18ACT15_10680 [soil metagenome]
MLPVPSSPLIAGIGGLVVAGVFLFIGFLIADALIGRRDFDNIIRVGLALPGFLVFTLVMMLAHIASSGEVLSNPWLTRAVVAVTAAVLVGRKLLTGRERGGPGARNERKPYLALGAVVVAGIILWGFPATQLLPLDHDWDTDRDGGYASELLNGETTPSATVTGEVPNDYPWMHAATAALLASFTAGGRGLHAHTPLYFVQVLGGILALFALGRELTGRWHGGAAAALFGALSGGFGYLVSRGPAVVLVPRSDGGRAALDYLGDMLFVRSYNMSFNNLAPAFPRDLGYALLAAFLLLLALGFARHSLGALFGAGVVLGLIGLTTGESMPFGLGAAVLLTVAPPSSKVTEPSGAKARFRRWQVAAALLLPALGVWALWAGPLLYNYFQLGGFFASYNTPVVLTPLAFIGCWGLTAPFALYGSFHFIPQAGRDPGARIVFALLLSALVMLSLSILVPLIPVEGFTTLSRAHRYWPLLYLPLALYAAVGASRLLDTMAAKRPALALALAALAVALAVPSPLLASVSLADRKPAPRPLESSLLGKRTMLNLMAPQPGLRCAAAVPADWSHAAFSYTGYRLVLFRWTPGLSKNAAHIRWRGIYERIPTTKERVAANRRLLYPAGERKWKALARKWGVNVVAVPRWGVPRWMRDDYGVQRTWYGRKHVSVVWVKPCREAAASATTGAG